VNVSAEVSDYILSLTVSLFPVLLFLLALSLLDSYKLVSGRALAIAIGAGIAAAIASLVANTFLIDALHIPDEIFDGFVAPPVEEFIKALFVVYLIRARRVGFMVDAAITGFAVGAGFAIFENGWYVENLSESRMVMVIWVVRGFGTAIMHGGTTAIFALISKNLFDRHESRGAVVFLPGLLAAVLLHSFYNHFLFSPVISTILIHITLPLVIMAVFYQSERSTRRWLGAQFDTDQELLDTINSGRVSDTHLGMFFRSIRESFPPEIVVDMLCYLRIHVELAINAKGLLLMREAGFDPEVAPDVHDKLAELKHLEKSIGRTGQLAIKPLVHTSHRDLWQIYMLGKS
jgi:RsiW-degrading membrane proteinase PrsW (M82 family)